MVKPAVFAMTLGIQVMASAHANDQTGSWGPLLDWNINPIHAILTPGNTLMTFGQGGGVEYSKVLGVRSFIATSTRQTIHQSTNRRIVHSTMISNLL